MALSLLTRFAPKAARKSSAGKSITARKYSSHGHETGPVEKRTINARVVFPSPIGRSNVSSLDAQVAIARHVEQNATITPEKHQGTIPCTRSTDTRSSRGSTAHLLTYFYSPN